MVLYAIQFTKDKNFFYNEDENMYIEGITKATFYDKVEDVLSIILVKGLHGTGLVVGYRLEAI